MDEVRSALSLPLDALLMFLLEAYLDFAFSPDPYMNSAKCVGLRFLCFGSGNSAETSSSFTLSREATFERMKRWYSSLRSSISFLDRD